MVHSINILRAFLLRMLSLFVFFIAFIKANSIELKEPDIKIEGSRFSVIAFTSVDVCNSCIEQVENIVLFYKADVTIFLIVNGLSINSVNQFKNKIKNDRTIILPDYNGYLTNTYNVETLPYYIAVNNDSIFYRKNEFDFQIINDHLNNLPFIINNDKILLTIKNDNSNLYSNRISFYDVDTKLNYIIFPKSHELMIVDSIYNYKFISLSSFFKKLPFDYFRFSVVNNKIIGLYQLLGQNRIQYIFDLNNNNLIDNNFDFSLLKKNEESISYNCLFFNENMFLTYKTFLNNKNILDSSLVMVKPNNEINYINHHTKLYSENSMSDFFSMRSINYNNKILIVYDFIDTLYIFDNAMNLKNTIKINFDTTNWNSFVFNEEFNFEKHKYLYDKLQFNYSILTNNNNKCMITYYKVLYENNNSPNYKIVYYCQIIDTFNTENQINLTLCENCLPYTFDDNWIYYTFYKDGVLTFQKKAYKL
ncbi:MAG: hypothetical protein ACOVNU_13005 [Candidatus Kapaibacteriota bacterium]